MKIKEEFKKLIPALSVEEYKQLEENCLAEGIRESIITWNGYIIDGHNRYEIATRHDLKYESIDKNFDSEEDVKEWMICNQFGRRNLSNFQRSVLVLELESVFSKRAKEQQIRKPESVIQISEEQKPIVAIKELAKIANVSHDTIAKVKKIQATATPEIKAQLNAGTISINEAYQDIKKEEKQQIKTDERERLAEIGKTKKIDIDFRLGDFEEVFKDIPDGSIDCIITDPPYPYEFIEVWSKLSIVAKRVLKPNGYCIAYSGQMNLPEVIKRMNEHLNYYWTFSLIHTGSRQLINGRSLFCGWKPILVFQNGFKKLDKPFDDFIMGTGMEKTHHKWQQAELELKHLINNFTKEGDVIMEPFAGGGTTIIAALKLNRNIIAAEIDETSYNVSKQRISEWKS
jgi:16S rRNA G966 N2-methylase RsmD